jgi:hypothetical protein
MNYTLNGTNGTTSHTSYTPEDIDRLTAAGVVFTWEDMDAEDRLACCLANPHVDEWLHADALATFADFRPIRHAWVRIKAGYRRLGGDTRILEEAVQGVLDERRTTAATTPALLTTCVADVAPEAVAWLWEPYIALGTLCMLDGDPGIGKSLLMLQLAANISQGLPFPDQGGTPTIGTREPHTVLIMTREDSLAKTIRPRLDASGADVSRIHVSATWLDAQGKEQAFTLKHLPLLEAELQRLKPRLVVLDPIQSFFGDIDMHRANQTRQLLDPLGALADKYNCAIVCVRHPAKPGEGVGKALHRGLGSVDIIGAARTGLFIEQYPGDDTQALMCQTKSNLGPKGRTQIFSKHEGVFAWVRPSRLSDEDLAGSGRGPNHRAFLEAVLWLEQRLEGGLAWNATDIEAEAELQEISSSLLKRAKKALRVVSAQLKGEPHAGWTWRLPPLSLPLTRTPSTDASVPTDTTDATDTPDLKSMTYEDVGVRDSVASDASEVSGVSEDGVVGEPIVFAVPGPVPPGPACPECRCLNVLMLGEYGACPLCQWKGKLVGEVERTARDWCPGGESLVATAPCIHEHVNDVGTCNDCGTQL